MLDPKYLRNNLDEVAKRLDVRGFQLDVNTIRELEAKRKFVQDVVQALQHKRNMNSKAVGHAKANPNEIIGFDLMSMKEINVELARADRELTLIQNELGEIVSRIPNIPHPTVPFGLSEEFNQEIRRVGEPKAFSFTPKDHVELGARNDMMDFTLATKITGARFVVLQRELARLHRALIQFMLDVHTNVHGYQEVYVPYMVNKESLFGTGQLPKLIDDLFAINGDQHYFLIPTAEVPVTNLVRDTIIAAEKLPLKYTCHTPCFRSEAGSYGKDTRGMIRQHQFEKVEILQIVQPEDSYKVHEEITSHAEAILKKLDLPYRVVALCGGDLGFSSAKTYDLEVWLPGQQKYREISSCSNFEDFQARRMQARWRDPKTNKPELVHTLNGSGLAIGRTLVAIMENFQDEAGKIHIPEVLWPYTGGMKSI